MGAGQDFNYKVALASGLKSLQAGRLRQAEEQFRFLVQKFPETEGGYRGLAKVLVELEDRPAAIAILRDGAAAMTRGADRAGAITMLRDAVALDPMDLASHRRLAAAHSLAGDADAAMGEVERYVRLQLDAHDPGRAQMEVIYAVRTLGGDPRFVALAERLGVTVDPGILARPAARQRAPEPTPVDTVETAEATDDRVDRPSAHLEPIVELASEPVADEDAPVATAAAAPDWERADSAGAATMQDEAEAVAEAPPAVADTAALQAEALVAEARAAELLAAGDAAAPAAALAAAEAHIRNGHAHAASDLLLHLIATDLAPHEAQRLLADVAGMLGQHDVAEAKRGLLAEAVRLEAIAGTPSTTFERPTGRA